MKKSAKSMRYLAPLSSLVASLAMAMSVEPPSTVMGAPAEFHFARMMYVDQAYGRRSFNGWWQQDFPEAERYFLPNLQRMTRINVGEPVQVRLTDEDLFEYPWLYATQTGDWDLNEEEVTQLREYLLRGGFLMCDDFWGAEWEVFAEAMTRVFPDREMVPLHDEDAVLHVVFTIDESTQIPGIRHLRDLPGLPPPQWFGIYDDAGRLMVGINYNQDVGDSWEHADDTRYPQPMTAQGYRFGVNYITYAMTH
jgi:hypothetical protein